MACSRELARWPAPQWEPMGLDLEALSFDSGGQIGISEKYRTSPSLRCKPPAPQGEQRAMSTEWRMIKKSGMAEGAPREEHGRSSGQPTVVCAA